MIRGGAGSIVVTLSIVGSVVGAGSAAASYIASKHGVIGLTKQIAVDYGKLGICANAIQPAGLEGSNLGRHARKDAIDASTPITTLARGTSLDGAQPARSCAGGVWCNDCFFDV